MMALGRLFLCCNVRVFSTPGFRHSGIVSMQGALSEHFLHPRQFYPNIGAYGEGHRKR